MSFYHEIRKFLPNKTPENYVWVLYDQLSIFHPILKTSIPQKTCLIFIETSQKPKLRPYHKQKLTLLLSSMRHFALEKAEEGFSILYQYSERTYAETIQDIRKTFKIPKIRLLEPSEFEVRKDLVGLEFLEIQENSLFLSSKADFDQVFPNGKKRFLQETFYRFMRKKYSILMEKDNKTPNGGKWNYDLKNRSAWKKTDPVPKPFPKLEKDAITLEVMDLVQNRYKEHYGNLNQFDWPVTRKQAMAFLEHFFQHLLPNFGKFEDAMSVKEPFLFHSRLSALVHLGLLHPMELITAALKQYSEKKVSIESVEGFVRQILGWREYMRHVYSTREQFFQETNFFQMENRLPDFFWKADSTMTCVDQTVETVLEHGYSHHITRLMVLSNLSNLLEVNPNELNEWFWFAYVDAFEWVVTPNVKGMGTFADGGLTASKPYIASGNYIQKMGNEFCKNCKFDPKKSTEENACPLNSLYWNFIDSHKDFYKKLGRPDFSISHWEKMDPEKKTAILEKAKLVRKKLLKS